MLGTRVNSGTSFHIISILYPTIFESKLSTIHLYNYIRDLFLKNELTRDTDVTSKGNNNYNYSLEHILILHSSPLVSLLIIDQ